MIRSEAISGVMGHRTSPPKLRLVRDWNPSGQGLTVQRMEIDRATYMTGG